ncbi:UNVERIFIED_CONTAM: hypothetical protein HDU68_007474 [Siphonaria sp. JEL0065]|nr:hypothetical protein HDU68_007474 [Siphonaria sp. JEL0065]
MFPKIIVTGYGPFRDIVDNPSDLIAKNVTAQIQDPTSKLFKAFANGSVANRTVAVSHEGLGEFYSDTKELIESENLTHIVHVGVSAASTKVNFETIAFNVTADSGLAQYLAKQRAGMVGSGSDDKEAEDVAGGKIDSSNHALDLLPTTFPVHRHEFHDYIQLNNATTSWSRDAGWYYCNEIFYSSVLLARKLRRDNKSRPLIKVIFVHVPLAEVLSIQTCADLIVGFLEVDASLSKVEE